MKRKFFAVGLSICLTVLTLFSFVGCFEKRGTVYSFEKAYEKGWLTIEDFMNISYYRHGKVWVKKDGEKQEIEYQPTIEKPEMSKRLEKSFKSVISNYFTEEVKRKKTLDDITIIHYLGSYHGLYAVEYKIYGVDKGQSTYPDAIVDNIVFGWSNNMLSIIKFD